ncbi:hypothetical protein QTO34_013125 [Cnephaeus nilssonii]|uniref:Uncharacterized protein n=1 Tax=Cnephaeus nilssonii TaxID=3371016 RepID=A0AA40LSF5_CNENI|nr:hypothetical protein QTO34_013125 [Eptesicus nilssonii]
MVVAELEKTQRAALPWTPWSAFWMAWWRSSASSRERQWSPSRLKMRAPNYASAGSSTSRSTAVTSWQATSCGSEAHGPHGDGAPAGCGYYNMVVKLAWQSGIQDLVNIEMFLTAKEMEDPWRDARRPPAWPGAMTKSQLHKMKSCQEFSLRIQGFIELIREQETGRHETCVETLQSGRGEPAWMSLAGHGHAGLPSRHAHPPHYKDLLDPAWWRMLIQQF